METAPSIFISYASPDQDKVIPYFEYLDAKGFNVWLDCRRLKPGQHWDFEVRRALDKASFVLVFVSQNSYDRRGYAQRELKLALDKLAEKLIDDIYIIPVLLDDAVSIPEQLKAIHCIRASSPDCNSRIADALNHQLVRIGAAREETQKKERISWTPRTIKEAWDGIPGYEVELQYLDFHSQQHRHITEVSDYIKGRLLANLFRHRGDKISPMPELFNYGQDKYSRTNTFDAHCGEPRIIGKVLCIRYVVSWYGAGAAHPNHYFETYNFLLEPLLLISSLKDVFKEPEAVLPVLQEEARKKLYAVRFESNDGLDRKWIDEGTADWEHFEAFNFSEQGVELLFAPYQVSSYACGPQFAEVPFGILAPLMRPEYVSALEIDRFARRP